jgi:predicted amidohydrolase YtcJ
MHLISSLHRGLFFVTLTFQLTASAVAVKNGVTAVGRSEDILPLAGADRIIDL